MPAIWLNSVKWLASCDASAKQTVYTARMSVGRIVQAHTTSWAICRSRLREMVDGEVEEGMARRNDLDRGRPVVDQLSSGRVTRSNVAGMSEITPMWDPGENVESAGRWNRWYMTRMPSRTTDTSNESPRRRREISCATRGSRRRKRGLEDQTPPLEPNTRSDARERDVNGGIKRVR